MKIVGYFIFGLLLLCHGFGFGQAQYKIDSLHQVLGSVHQTKDTLHVDVLNQIGFEYWTIDPAKSERYGKEALAISESIKYTRGKAMAHRVIGVSHWSRGDYLNALTHLFESQNFYKASKDLLGEANSTMNIGMVYADQKDFGRALENYQYANQLFEKLGKRDRIGTAFDKIGTVYLEKGDLDKAFDYLHRGLEIHQENKFLFGVMEACNRLGLLYKERGEYNMAMEYLKRSRAISLAHNDNEHITKNNENIASVFIKLGLMDSAKYYLDEAYPIAVTGQYHKWLRDILKDYRDIFVSKKDYEKAFLYGEHYEKLKDSIFSEEKRSQITNLQFEHQMAQQQQALKLHEKQIVLLQQEKRLERFLIFGLAGGIIALLGGGVYFIRQQRIRYRQNQGIAERKRKLATIELENAKLREDELKKSLDFKNKELTSYTINFIQKNELIESIRQQLDGLKKIIPAEELKGINTLIRKSASVDNDWEDFKRTFENVHHNFFAKLLDQYPDLTAAELRLCALICLNLSIKEMASLLGISADSVKTARYRLRKRFNLGQHQNLTDFVIGFG